MNVVIAPPSAKVAYFSMAIALDPGVNTYSGGLGVLGTRFEPPPTLAYQ